VRKINKLIIVLMVLMLNACVWTGLFNSAQSEFEEGMGYFNIGQYEEAILHFNRATELDPMFGRPYLYLGRSYLNLGRWVDAIQPLRTALRISPDETKREITDILIDALLGAALSDFKKGSFSGSIGYLKEALRMEPQSSKVTNELVTVLIAQGSELLSHGKSKDAIASFREAVELSPNSGSAYLGLAKAFLKNGDIFKAFSAAESAIKIDPSNSDARSLINDLKK
jgi:Flp pilus assembly protein TadD